MTTITTSHPDLGRASAADKEQSTVWGWKKTFEPTIHAS